MIDVSRFALVIGSQCDTQLPLRFLPDLAEELYDVMTDPHLGACDSALGDARGLLLDPTCDEVVEALYQAFTFANDASSQNGSSMLFVAFLGHGMANDDDFFFLAKDATGEGTLRGDVYLSQHLKDLLRRSANLNGLIVWLDTCQSGVAAKESVVKWGKVGLGKDVRRYEVLTAADDRPAYGGDFSRALITTLGEGVPTAGETLDANDLRGSVQDLPRQQPQRVTVDGGGWSFEGDSGLWLSKNVALRSLEDDAAGTIAIARASELTNFLQPTPTLDNVVAMAKEHRCVALTGPRGAGKSTTAAALAKPASSNGHVPNDFVHAIAFGRHDTQGPIVASALAGQLRETIDGFGRAVNQFDEGLDAAEREGQPALDRRVLGPLALMNRRQPVRLVIDSFDELPRETQDTLRTSISAVINRDGDDNLPDIRFVLTARPGATLPSGAISIELGEARDDAIDAYFRQRRIDETNLSTLVDLAAGNWLHAKLIADLAARPGFAPGYLSTGLTPILTRLYDSELHAAGAGDPDRWETMLRPVLGVCAAAGVGPVLPLPICKAAAVHFGLPEQMSGSAVRDALGRLSGLTVRSRPGQAGERVGVFHGSLINEYLSREDVTEYSIDLREAHEAIVCAIDELAPAEEHDPEKPLHRYAMVAEPDHIWSSGNYAGVVDSLVNRPLNRAIDERERWDHWATLLEDKLGAEHEATVTAQENLARWTGEAGDYEGARAKLMEVLPVRARISKPASQKTLDTEGRLAYFTAKVGRLVEARDRYQTLLDMYIRNFDLSTLETWMNYARFTGEAGDPARARDELEMLVSMSRAVCGDEHPRTIAISENLARFTGEAGDFAGARDRYRAVLPLREMLSGPSDPDTLTTRSNLAYFTGEAGDPATAREQLRAVLPLRRDIGVRHPDTLTTWANLARFVGEAGDPRAAVTELRDLVKVRRDISGPGHPDTLTTLEICERFTAQLADPDAARATLTRILPLREEISGNDHPDTLATRTNIACFAGMAAEPAGTYEQVDPQGTNTDQVVPEYRETGPSDRGPTHTAKGSVGFWRKRTSTPEHPDTLTIRAPLAHMSALARNQALGNSERDRTDTEALEHVVSSLQELWDKRIDVSGERHPDTLTTWENFAYFLGIGRSASEATEELAAALVERADVSGNDHPDTLTTRGNLAYFTGVAGDHEAARAMLAELLSDRERVSGKHHPDTLAARRSLTYWTQIAAGHETAVADPADAG
jgi:hypothetical protein